MDTKEIQEAVKTYIPIGRELDNKELDAIRTMRQVCESYLKVEGLPENRKIDITECRCDIQDGVREYVKRSELPSEEEILSIIFKWQSHVPYLHETELAHAISSRLDKKG